MKKLIMLVGPPGSGKSTKAKQLAEEQFLLRISQDDQGQKGHKEMFEEALKSDVSIIIDRMNHIKAQRDYYLNAARQNGYSTEIIVLHVPREKCLERCNQRVDHPTVKTPEDASRAVGEFFKRYERVSDDEADVVSRLGWDSTSKGIVVDIDGTLSDPSHRHHLFKRDKNDKPNWKAFFSKMGDDPVNEWCRQITNNFYTAQVPVVVCSARPDNYRSQTREWLEKHKVFYDHLIMRPRDDSRKDAIVKEIILDFELKTRYDILMCIDDRKQVVDMYRSHGLTVLDCAGEKGNF